jgi:hypothetical protein
MKLAVTMMPGDTLLIADRNPRHNMQIGQQYMIDAHVRGDRNPKFHAKFWAMLKFFRDFLPWDMDDDSLKQWAVIGAGYYDVAPDGVLLAKSIAFDAMPEAEFERLYSSALDYLLREVAPDAMTEDDVNQALSFV